MATFPPLLREKTGLTEGFVAVECDSKELMLKEELESEKSNFKTLCGQLQGLKSEIEHVQHLLEKAKVQVQKDFEQWWAQQATLGKVHPSAIQPAHSVWCTPSTSSTGSLLPHPEPTPPVLPRPTSFSSSLLSQRSRSRRTRVVAAHFSRDITSDSHPSGSHEKEEIGSEFDTVHGRSSTRPAHSQSFVTSSTTQMLFNRRCSMNGIVESMPVSSQSEDAGVSIRTADSTRTDSLGFSGGGIHMHADSLPETARMSGSFTQPQPLFGGTVNTTIQHRQTQTSIPLTGDSKADADIMAFYKARQKLIQRGQPR